MLCQIGSRNNSGSRACATLAEISNSSISAKLLFNLTYDSLDFLARRSLGVLSSRGVVCGIRPALED